MRDTAGKVAVITGAGSGIGRGMAHAFADVGMDIVISDIELKAAETTAQEIRAKGRRALAVQTDVTQQAQVEALAETAFREMGAVHVLCNNAGVGQFGFLSKLKDTDWDWQLGVNLNGVIHGIRAFVPRLKKQGQPAHIVNTSSMMGVMTAPGPGIYYIASKYAVAGLSEHLHKELVDRYDIATSVLCPGHVNTRILEASRNRPKELGGQGVLPDRDLGMGSGMDPIDVGRLVLRAIRDRRLYIFTHPSMKPMVTASHAAIQSDFDWAQKTLEELGVAEMGLVQGQEPV